MERMTKKAEKKLIKSVEKVVSKVNTGEHPTDAVISVCKAANYNPDMIRRVVETYNQSKTLHHLDEKVGSDRHLSFALADPDAAIAGVFPENYATPTDKHNEKLASATGLYNLQGNLFAAQSKAHIKSAADELFPDLGNEKQAAATAARQMKFQKKAINQGIHNAQVEQENALVKISELNYKLHDELRAHLTMHPFHELECTLHSQYGEKAASLVEIAWQLGEAEKFGHRRAQPHEIDVSSFTLADFDMQPFATIENLVKQARKLHTAQSALDTLSEKKAELDTPEVTDEASTTETVVSALQSALMDKESEDKEAALGITGALLGASPLALDQVMDAGEDVPGKTLANSLASLEDPDHRDKLNEIRTQAALHDLMANDEVISTYDPSEVARSFNDLHSVAPQALTNNLILRDMLRKQLSYGGLDTMEVGQVADIDRKLRGDESRSSVLGDLSAGVPGANNNPLSFGGKYGK